MDVKVEYMPSVISTSRPFQVSLYLIHLSNTSKEHYSNAERGDGFGDVWER